MKTCYGEMDIDVKNGRARVSSSAKSTQTRAGRAPGRSIAIDDTRSPAYRSKLEADYATYLNTLQHVGVVTCWWYEPMRLRLAKATSYRPDFLVQEGRDLSFREVKGWHPNRRDSLTHLKVAAEMFPCFKFVLVSKDKGQWIERPI